MSNDSIICDMAHNSKKKDARSPNCATKTWLINIYHDSYLMRFIHMWHDSWCYKKKVIHVRLDLQQWHDTCISTTTHTSCDSFIYDMTHDEKNKNPRPLNYATMTWLIYINPDSCISYGVATVSRIDKIIGLFWIIMALL